MPRFSNAPTRFPYGATNRSRESSHNGMTQFDPTVFHTYFNDFDNYIAGDWTLTETQAGATQAIADGDGGLLLLTNSAADDDLNSLQKVGESFLWAPGKPFYGKFRFRTNDATQSDIALGLMITDTSPIASVPTDAFYFLKADDAATMIFKAGKNSSYSNSGTILTLADNTYYSVAFFSSGDAFTDSTGTYYPFSLYAGAANDPPFVTKLNVLSTNMCDDEELTVTLALQNGAAAAKTLTIDYAYLALGR